MEKEADGDGIRHLIRRGDVVLLSRLIILSGAQDDTWRALPPLDRRD